MCDLGDGGLVGALSARGIESEVVKLDGVGKKGLGIRGVGEGCGRGSEGYAALRVQEGACRESC